MPNGDNAELWQAFNSFKLEYERRHAELARDSSEKDQALDVRLTRLEEVVKRVATKEDVARMDGIASRFEESLKRFDEKSEAMVTKTDVDWLKRAFWVAVAALVSVDLSLIGVLISHLTEH